MERPDLSYNYYYPFYTQSCIGDKKSFYKVETVIHLSDKRGILLSISYKGKNTDEIKVKELDDSRVLYDMRYKGTLIHYTSFAQEVDKIFKSLSSAKRQLTSENAYKKRVVFMTYLKHNERVEIELDFRNIRIGYDCSDYVIEDGLIKRTANANSENDVLLKRLQEVVSAIDTNTILVEMKNIEFEEKLDSTWNYFIDFFKSPKFIKKNEYLPK